MAKDSHSFQKHMLFTVFKTLFYFSLLRVCSTTTTANYFNFALSASTLDPTTEGFTITGEASSYLGFSVNTAGDVDGDGYDDIIIGAYGKNSNKGIAYVIYGGETSSFLDIDLSQTTLDPHTTGFTIAGGTYYYLGYSVSTAGDINNDGYDDIIIGAHAYSSSTGAAFVIYGGERSSMQNIDFNSGAILNPSTTGFKITGSAGGDCLGRSVSTAGDINHDGYDDIIVGAYGWSGQTGAAYVIYGGEKSSMSNWDFSVGAMLSPHTTGFMMKGSASSDQLGWSVSTAGDVNKDEYADIIVGANGKRSASGAAYVIFGGEKSSMSDLDWSTTTVTPSVNGFMLIGPSGNNQLGISVSTAGDINNDGYADIITGAYRWSSNTGAVYVIYGGERSSMLNYDFDAPSALDPLTTGFIMTGNTASTYFGWSVSAAGDMNKDGYNDILVGAYGESSSRGSVYVIYGGEKSSMKHLVFSSETLDPSSTGFIITGNANSDQFGFAVSVAGDINNDGYKDIIIGANTKSSNKGAAYVIHTGS